MSNNKTAIETVPISLNVELNNPLLCGQTVKNLTLLDCSRFQCIFPIGGRPAIGAETAQNIGFSSYCAS